MPQRIGHLGEVAGLQSLRELARTGAHRRVVQPRIVGRVDPPLRAPATSEAILDAITAVRAG